MASTKEILQKGFVIASGLAFLGMMTLPMLTVFNNKPNPPAASNATAPNQPPSPEERAKIVAIADGYAKVLEREPNNPTALQGLVEARLKLGDLKGAIPPLEKITQLYPEQKPLKDLLTVIKKQVAQGGSAPPPSTPSTPSMPSAPPPSPAPPAQP